MRAVAAHAHIASPANARTISENQFVPVGQSSRSSERAIGSDSGRPRQIVITACPSQRVREVIDDDITFFRQLHTRQSELCLRPSSSLLGGISMSARIRVVCFGVLFAFLAMPPGGEKLEAQGPKRKAAASRLKFEIYEDAANQFRWRLKAANGEI